MKKISFILVIFILVFCSFKVNVYATTSDEELRELLDQYEEELGDLEELKVVVDKVYDDLYSATEVTDELKQTLKNDVKELQNVTGINPLILNVLDTELTSQIDNLTDDSIDDLRSEISTIKEWIDERLEQGNGDSGNDNTGGSVDNTEKEDNTNNTESKDNIDNTNDTENKDNTDDNKEDENDNIKYINNTKTEYVGTEKKQNQTQVVLPYTGRYGKSVVILFAMLIITAILGIKYKKYKGIE